ncbi:uncharacterized protein LOC141649742 [Silene latifolia]|uniref:uncharacterized protein LOC141649742 n=1 Tax=Silene latifolia TaxID=37657 RepID=UPI003D770FB2
MSESNSDSDSSNDNIVDQNRLFDYQWEAEADERSEAIQNLIAQRMNEYVNRRIRQPNPPPRRRRRNIERNREEVHKQLYNDYFMDPVYPEELFRRRFRMHKHLFMRIVNALSANDRFFQQRVGGNGRPSFLPLQRCTTALRVLAYGTSTDSVDEYLRMRDTPIRDSLKLFVEGVISCFGNEYLRRPNPQDLGRLLHMGQARGFPGMLGSIECMHWELKSCPTPWAGQYAGRISKPTVILEAVALYDLWIWHAFFSTPGSLNDINVLERSPLFNDVLEESAPPINFSVNGTDYNMGYYLERAFGVLQARFAFIKRPCLLWDRANMGKVLMACIIMHNMIVEDERETYLNYENIIAEFKEDNLTSAIDDPYEYHRLRRSPQERFIEIHGEIRDRAAHNALKNDLIEHIWQNFRNSN